jgi:hypothetical protein
MNAVGASHTLQQLDGQNMEGAVRFTTMPCRQHSHPQLRLALDKMLGEFREVSRVLLDVVIYSESVSLLVHFNPVNVNVPSVLTESKIDFKDDICHTLESLCQLNVFARVAMGRPVLTLTVQSAVRGLAATRAPVGGGAAATETAHFELVGSGFAEGCRG